MLQVYNIQNHALHLYFQAEGDIPYLVVDIRTRVLLLIYRNSLAFLMFCRYLPRHIACQVDCSQAVVGRRLVFVVAGNEGMGDLYVLVNTEVKREGAEVLFRCGNHFLPPMDEVSCHE